VRRLPQASCFFALVDPAFVTGARRWIKPAKFTIAFLFYFWTLAWMLDRMALAERWRRAIALGVVALVAIEIACSGGQAARGVPSHVNATTAVDGGVYSLMGVVGINTLILTRWLRMRACAGAPPTPPSAPASSPACGSSCWAP
jgi:hypothetical protein